MWSENLKFSEVRFITLHDQNKSYIFRFTISSYASCCCKIYYEVSAVYLVFVRDLLRRKLRYMQFLYRTVSCLLHDQCNLVLQIAVVGGGKPFSSLRNNRGVLWREFDLMSSMSPRTSRTIHNNGVSEAGKTKRPRESIASLATAKALSVLLYDTVKCCWVLHRQM